jgi:hypothetical protein
MAALSVFGFVRDQIGVGQAPQIEVGQAGYSGGNLFGGAGCGKTTLAAELFVALKKQNILTQLQ